MGVVCEVGRCNYMEGGAVVNYDRDEFENVDRDKCFVFVVGFE